MKPRYSDDELIKIHSNYINLNISVKEYCTINNLSYNCIFKGFKRNKLIISPQSTTRRKFPINENFFEKIENEKQAYILGFLYADGCNHEDKQKISLGLAIKDKDILEKISKILLYDNIHLKQYPKRNKIILNIINKKIFVNN